MNCFLFSEAISQLNSAVNKQEQEMVRLKVIVINKKLLSAKLLILCLLVVKLEDC